MSNILGFTEKSDFYGGGREGSRKTNIEGRFHKKWGLVRKRGMMFLREVDTPIHTVYNDHDWIGRPFFPAVF